MTLHPIEMPEANCEDVEFFCDTLDCMNPWYEPDSSFDYSDDIYVPDCADAHFHLEL